MGDRSFQGVASVKQVPRARAELLAEARGAVQEAREALAEMRKLPTLASVMRAHAILSLTTTMLALTKHDLWARQIDYWCFRQQHRLMQALEPLLTGVATQMVAECEESQTQPPSSADELN